MKTMANLEAAVKVRHMFQLYIGGEQDTVDALCFLGTSTTLLFGAVAAISIVLNPTLDEILGNPITLLCLC